MRNLTYIFLYFCILVGCSKKSTNSEKEFLISFEPQRLVLSNGQIGVMAIEFEDLDEYIFGVTLQITFDSTIVSFSESVGFDAVNFFEGDIVTFVEEDGSVIHIALTLTQGQSEERGSGYLGELTFTGNSPGSSAIEIIPAELYFYDSTGDTVTIPDLEIEAGSITVQ